ncbi:TPM domain-containing protein [Bacillota bacterium LX-D]|nr:TPM domain-containing protein [Bacillota bacterium LX-D]
MKKCIKLLSIIFVFSLFLGSQAFAAINIPKPSQNIYVNDFANLITPEDEEIITETASTLDNNTSAQVAVVTINSLNGIPISDYTNELFRNWGIGNKKENTGVLILINKENLLKNIPGKVRIEVGYGLEGILPDGKVGRILDEKMIPLFNEKEYSQGILAGFQAVTNVIQEDSSGNTDTTHLEYQFKWWHILLIILGIIFLILLEMMGFPVIRIIFVLLSMGGRRGGGSGGGFGGGSSGGGGAER